MRLFIAACALLGAVVIGGAVAPEMVAADTGVLALAQEPTGQLDVNIDTGGDGAWWANPIWIAIGVIALVLLVVIIAMAARGGGTTVIRD